MFFFFPLNMCQFLTTIRMDFYVKFDVRATTIAKRTMELTLLTRKLSCH